MCAMWALRHAASDTTAVRPALLMGGRGGSAADIVVVAHGTSTSSSVGGVFGNRYRVYVEARTNYLIGAVFRLQKLNRNKSSNEVHVMLLYT